MVLHSRRWKESNQGIPHSVEGTTILIPADREHFSSLAFIDSNLSVENISDSGPSVYSASETRQISRRIWNWGGIGRGLLAALFALWHMSHISLALSDLVKISCAAQPMLPPTVQSRSFAEFCDFHLDSRLGFSGRRLAKLQQRFEGHEQRLDNMESQIRKLQGIVEEQLDIAILTRDFALRGNGAQIIKEFTSPSFAGGYPPYGVNHPELVLENPPQLGECWEFQGSRGQIGIQLAEPTRISNISMFYVHPRRIGEASARRAPRSFVLWGHMKHFESTFHPTKHRSPGDLLAGRNLPPEVLPSDYFVQIISADYNMTDELPRIIFSVVEVVPVSFSVVVLEISSNWGSDTTCLYHTGIYGDFD